MSKPTILPIIIPGQATMAARMLTTGCLVSGSCCLTRFKKFPRAAPKIGKNTPNKASFYE
jgi:hypothetical protein